MTRNCARRASSAASRQRRNCADLVRADQDKTIPRPENARGVVPHGVDGIGNAAAPDFLVVDFRRRRRRPGPGAAGEAVPPPGRAGPRLERRLRGGNEKDAAPGRLLRAPPAPPANVPNEPDQTIRQKDQFSCDQNDTQQHRLIPSNRFPRHLQISRGRAVAASCIAATAGTRQAGLRAVHGRFARTIP